MSRRKSRVERIRPCWLSVGWHWSDAEMVWHHESLRGEQPSPLLWSICPKLFPKRALKSDILFWQLPQVTTETLLFWIWAILTSNLHFYPSFLIGYLIKAWSQINGEVNKNFLQPNLTRLIPAAVRFSAFINRLALLCQLFVFTYTE